MPKKMNKIFWLLFVIICGVSFGVFNVPLRTVPIILGSVLLSFILCVNILAFSVVAKQMKGKK